MKFQKIQVTKRNTLNIVFENENGDIVNVAGANIVHKDLKACMNGLISHIAFMTEQRDTANKTLKEVEAMRIQDDNKDNVYKWITVESITIGGGGSIYTLSGSRILQTGDVIRIESPSVNITENKYEYCNELDLAIDAVKYEAESYYNEQKWGVKEGTLDFGDDNPFNAENLTADQVPDIGNTQKPKKGKLKAKIVMKKAS